MKATLPARASMLLACSVPLCAAAAETPSAAPTPPGALAAEVYDSDCTEADCAYHAARLAGDGAVYFSVSAHSPAFWARVYRFDPSNRTVRLFWTPEACTPGTGSVSQGKIHSPLTEYRGELYMATHTGHYKTRHVLPGTDTHVDPYQGGFVYAVNLTNGQGRAVCAPLQGRPVIARMEQEVFTLFGEGLITTAMDSRRGLFYAMSWPSAIFAKVDVATGKAKDYGKMQDGAEAVPRFLPQKPGETEAQRLPNPRYQRVLRALGMDDRGNVYGSAGDGSVWRYDLEQDRVVPMKARMENATRDENMPKLPSYLNMWRAIVWDDKEKVFYGVHWATSWLFRFSPAEDKVEPVMKWSAAGKPVPDFAQIGLAMGPGRVLYGFVHAPSIKPRTQRSVHLITLDLDRRAFKDHGNVLSEDGRTLMFAETCMVAPGGDVYTVGWMEPPPDRLREVEEMRRQTGVAEVKYPAIMALVRIPAARVIASKP